MTGKDNMSNVLKKMRRRNTEDGQANMQAALNHLLWKIVMQSGGTLSVSTDELKSVPEEAILHTTVDSATDKFVVVAGLKLKER